MIYGKYPEGGSREEVKNAKETAYEDLGRIFQKCLEILQGNSSNWFTRLYRTLLKERQRIEALPEEEQIFLKQNIDEVIDLFQSWARPEGKKKPVVTGSNDSELSFSEIKKRIHQLEKVFEFKKEAAPSMKIDSCSIEKLTALFPEQIQLTTKDGRQALKFRENQKQDWVEVNVPQSDTVFYKGGVPRVLTKILAGADPALLKAEIPMNDIDIIAWSNGEDQEEIVREATALGADLEGIEMVENDQPLQEVLKGRDVDLNQCFFGKNGLVFSDNALRAAETGSIDIMDPTERGLWGSESYYYSKDNLKLIKGRGLYRLFKFIAEGKAKSFVQIELNRQNDMGIYWLVLARKFSRKQNAGQLLNRLYEIGKRAGQTLEGEQDIYDVLNRAHDQYPFFEFSDAQQSTEDIVLWLSRKLAKLADRQFRHEQGMKSEQFHERFEGDENKEVISLEGYVDDEQKNQETAAKWQSFVSHLDTESVKEAA